MIWKKCQFLYLKKTFTAPDSASHFLQPSASQVRATLGFILKIRFPSNSIRVLLLPHSNTNNLNSITLNTVVVQCIQFCLKYLHKHDLSFLTFSEYFHNMGSLSSLSNAFMEKYTYFFLNEFRSCSISVYLPVNTLPSVHTLPLRPGIWLLSFFLSVLLLGNLIHSYSPYRQVTAVCITAKSHYFLSY